MKTGNIENKIYRVRVELVALAILIPLVLVLGAVLSSWPRDTQDIQGTTKEEIQRVVTLNVQGLEEVVAFEIAVEGEITVQGILERAVAQHGLLLNEKDYGGELGVFVEAINGLAGDSRNGTYWHLYINDVLSPVGASTAKVASGDTVTWKYEKQHEEN